MIKTKKIKTLFPHKDNTSSEIRRRMAAADPANDPLPNAVETKLRKWQPNPALVPNPASWKLPEEITRLLPCTSDMHIGQCSLLSIRFMVDCAWVLHRVNLFVMTTQTLLTHTPFGTEYHSLKGWNSLGQPLH